MKPLGRRRPDPAMPPAVRAEIVTYALNADHVSALSSHFAAQVETRYLRRRHIHRANSIHSRTVMPERRDGPA